MGATGAPTWPEDEGCSFQVKSRTATELGTGPTFSVIAGNLFGFTPLRFVLLTILILLKSLL